MTPRPRLVGIFTLTALAILVAGLVVLTSGRWLAENRTFVIFFPSGAAGLKDGSTVSFRQIPVGQVRDVELVFTGRGIESMIKVIADVRRRAVGFTGGARFTQLTDAELAKALVDGGLRASIRSSSPIAGQKSVDLDFHPELPARYSGISAPYPEIPTAPTGMEVISEKIDQALKRISDVPIDEVLRQLQATLASAQKLLDGGDVNGAIRALRLTLEQANRTLTRAETTMGGVDGTLTSVRSTLSNLDDTTRKLQSTLEQLNRTLATVDRNVERSGELQYGAGKTLDDVDELVKSLQVLVDTLQRHPEALLQGKPRPEEK